MAVVLYVLPVLVLIVIPIDQIVRLLVMMAKDPMGYQRTRTFHQSLVEE